jgi:hypothetical protein
MTQQKLRKVGAPKQLAKAASKGQNVSGKIASNSRTLLSMVG